MSIILQLQIALWSIYALAWIAIVIGIICEAVSKAVIKVCRELKTIQIKER